MNSIEDIIEELRSRSDPSGLEGMARFGIDSSNALGVRMPVLRRMGRDLGKDVDLAQALWSAGLRETRVLATIVAPASTPRPTIESWLAEVSDWETCDQLCMNLVRHHRDAMTMIDDWSKDRRLFVRRAAFATLAAAAVARKGEEYDDVFIHALHLVEDTADDGRLLVRKAQRWALRSIAARGPTCQDAARRCAASIASSEKKAARRLGEAAMKELALRYG